MKATRLLFIAALVGCGERAPTGVPLEPLVLDPLAPGTALLRCAPLSPDSVTQTIGPLGGVLLIGPHRLSIPSGALDTSVTITAVAPADSVNRVHFTPQGLTFREPASLTMSYANCDGSATFVPKQIAYTGDGLAILELVPSFDSFWARAVTGLLRHFSDYAIAW